MRYAKHLIGAAVMVACSAATAGSYTIKNEADFVKQFGKDLVQVEPGVYRVNYKSSARQTTFSFGASGRAHDIRMLKAQLAEAVAGKDQSNEVRRYQNSLRKIIAALEAGAQKDYGDVCDSLYVLNASISLASYSHADADGMVSTVGPPAPPGIAGAPYTICVTSYVKVGGVFHYGGPDYGCQLANDMGATYEADTGSWGPGTCSSGGAFASVQGSCTSGPDYAAVSDADNPCN